MARGGNQAVARRPDGQMVTPTQNVNNLAALLDKKKDVLAAALPKHLTADRIIRVALTSIRKSDKLQKSTMESLAQSIVQSAQLGLELDNGLGHAYLVPYWNRHVNGYEAQFQLGYRGMLDLVFRSGQVQTAYAEAVYEGDKFRWTLGTEPGIQHEPGPNYGCEDPEKITHFYAVAVKKDGGRQFRVLPKEQVDKVRDQHAGKDRNGNVVGPWATHYVEMGMKTVFRRLFKWLPVSIEVQRAVAFDELQEAGVYIGDMDLGGGADLSGLKPADATVTDPGPGSNGNGSNGSAMEEAKRRAAERAQQEAAQREEAPPPDEAEPQPEPEGTDEPADGEEGGDWF